MENQESVNNQFKQQMNPPFGQQSIPNASAVLVLGIISIALCWCYGIVGIVCGIIALVLAGKSMKLLKENPTGYTDSSVKNMKAGRVCAIIGTCLSGLMLLYAIFVFVFFGALMTAGSMPWNQ